jgi:hypothetical protein
MYDKFNVEEIFPKKKTKAATMIFTVAGNKKPSSRESSTLMYDQTCFLLLNYKSRLTKYDINNTKFVAVEVSEIGK